MAKLPAMNTSAIRVGRGIKKGHFMKIETQEQLFTVQIQPPIISAEKARKQANVWLLTNIGNLLRAEKPQLIINQQRQLCWLMKVVLPAAKVAKPLGQIEVDVFSGEVLTDISVYNDLVTQTYASITC